MRVCAAGCDRRRATCTQRNPRVVVCVMCTPSHGGAHLLVPSRSIHAAECYERSQHRSDSVHASAHIPGASANGRCISPRAGRACLDTRLRGASRVSCAEEACNARASSMTSGLSREERCAPAARQCDLPAVAFLLGARRTPSLSPPRESVRTRVRTHRRHEILKF